MPPCPTAIAKSFETLSLSTISIQNHAPGKRRQALDCTLLTRNPFDLLLLVGYPLSLVAASEHSRLTSAATVADDCRKKKIDFVIPNCWLI